MAQALRRSSLWKHSKTYLRTGFIRTLGTTHKGLNKTDRSDVGGGGGNSKIQSRKKGNSEESDGLLFQFSCLLNPVLRSMDSLLNATNYIDYHYLWGHYKSLVSESENSPKFVPKSSYFSAKSAKFSAFQKGLRKKIKNF